MSAVDVQVLGVGAAEDGKTEVRLRLVFPAHVTLDAERVNELVGRIVKPATAPIAARRTPQIHLMKSAKREVLETRNAQMKARYDGGDTISNIAKAFGVRYQVVWYAKCKENWDGVAA